MKVRGTAEKIQYAERLNVTELQQVKLNYFLYIILLNVLFINNNGYWKRLDQFSLVLCTVHYKN